MKAIAIQEVKEYMGYKEESPCCKTCSFYVAADFKQTAIVKQMAQHCNRNAFPFEVERVGTCNYWSKRS